MTQGLALADYLRMVDILVQSMPFGHPAVALVVRLKNPADVGGNYPD